MSDWSTTRTVLRTARWRVVYLCFAAAIHTQGWCTPAVLTEVAQVRRLNPVQAGEKHAVEVEGVITHPYLRHSFFLHDGNEGIWVGLKRPTTLRQGQHVRVRGVSAPGEFAPVIGAATIDVIGEGGMPAAKPLSLEDVNTGSVDSQWIETSGIVRVVADPVNGRQDLELSTLGLRMRVEVTNCPSDLIGEHLVGAHVQVRGVAVTHWNSRRQLRRVWLAVPDPAFVTVLTPTASDISIPVEEIRSLLRFDPEHSSEHRVSVRGVVTYFAPGQFLYVQDGTGALMARTRETAGARVGDAVIVTGFPAPSEFSPFVEHATIAKVQGGERPRLPVPRRLTDPAKLLLPENHGELVELEAVVVDQLRQATDDILVLQSSDRLFQAVLHAAPEPHARLLAGSRLRVTGVYVAAESASGRYGLIQQVTGFRLLLRDARDVVVLEQPSWWTQQRLWRALWVLLLIVLGIGGLVVWLGRRVRKQEALLRTNLERELIMEERTRIGRELHDTLVQGFAGVSFQLQAMLPQLCSAPADVRQHIELALNMAHHSMAEARRSVWELRSGGLERLCLSEAIRRATQLLAAGSSVALEFVCEGEPRAIAADVENELLRLAQEAVVNALKHSGAPQISVKLEFHPERVNLTVCDNGSGFDQRASAADRGHHFGILGMHERAGRIGAEIDIESALGSGTCVRIVLPLNINARQGREGVLS